MPSNLQYNTYNINIYYSQKIYLIALLSSSNHKIMRTMSRMSTNKYTAPYKHNNINGSNLSYFQTIKTAMT